jgi:hypothetical protein|tara:strand:- start:176 stop:391 length:216 start_codon:yes stop_codon:yes gene_type:complete
MFNQKIKRREEFLMYKIKTEIKYEIGTEVIAKSKNIDVTCVGEIHNIIERNGIIYYAVCRSLFLAEELKVL